jgi:Type I phosphodiesterase / nucleotide pyrophosphatase
MKSVLPLFVFIDACGWEIINQYPFAQTLAPHRRRLDSVFGYSSACVPSIVSGRWPAEHRNWSYFVFDPAHSPFRPLSCLQWLPKLVTSRRRFRRWLSLFLKKPLKFHGYFDLYNLPFRHISLFDFTEKKSPLRPGGMNRGGNIFDFLQSRAIPYHVGDPERSETENLEDLIRCVQAEQIDFAFVYWPELDGLLHQVGNQSPEIPRKLRVYEDRLEQLCAIARQHYGDVRLYVFSDHGMANCDEQLDLKARIEALPVQMKRDYIAVYDSTMARFWFFDENARKQIVECLSQTGQGVIVTDEQLKHWGCYFPDRYFGELVFLVNEGVLIVPSDMGERPIRAMHGYHPNARHSYAALLTNHTDVPEEIVAIPDLFKLMTRDAEWARARNTQRGWRPPSAAAAFHAASS